MARLAGSVPVLPKLSSPLPAMGSGRHDGASLAGAGAGPGRTRPPQSVRVLRRRHLRPGEKRGLSVGKTKRGKGTKIMALADRSGLPVAVGVHSASPHEVRLVEGLLDTCWTQAQPRRLIGDRAYDSDRLDEKLWRERGIELIAPNRRNRTKSQDRRPLRRYRRRWKIERLFAWLQNSRRVVVRYELHEQNFLGMIHLACVLILLKHL